MASETERDVKITDGDKNSLSLSATVSPDHHLPAPADYHNVKLECAGHPARDLSREDFMPLVDAINSTFLITNPDKALVPLEMDFAGGVGLPVGHFSMDWDVSPGNTPLQQACTPKISSTAKTRTIG